MTRFVVAKKNFGRAVGDNDLRARLGFGNQSHGALGANAPSNDSSATEVGLRATIVEAAAVSLVSAPTGTIVEEEILHWPEVILPPDWPPGGAIGSFPLASGPATDVTVRVTGGMRPLANATVRLCAQGPTGYLEFRGLTDGGGSCTFSLPVGHAPSMVLVSPTGGFWPMLARGNALGASIECPTLPAEGPLGWWHVALGLDAAKADLGRGIRVGVVDTGAGPHPCLQHIESVGAFLGGNALPPGLGADVGEHGSHVSGTIGARPAETGDYAGIAPGCDLLTARVFKGPEGGASNADIANAIDSLSSQHGADLINLSLGASIPSQVVQLAIQEAADRGTLCICAAGNDGGAVLYPAAFPETIAVAALGLAGWGPPGSLSAARSPSDRSLFGIGDLYAASFTSHGDAIGCAAPGVGILATVPNRHGAVPLHGAMDGTSMASPVVCGALAALLSQDAAYRALPRSAKRTEAARRTLEEALSTVGLPAEYEGRGMPRLSVVSTS